MAVGGFGMRQIIRRLDGVVVGNIGFHGPPAGGEVEIGFDLARSCRGGGYATAALIQLAAWALSQPGVDVVVALTGDDNIAAQRVMERAGFVETAPRDGFRAYLLGPSNAPDPHP
jgi:RimJ/RimL family protein N-acetyltransferase